MRKVCALFGTSLSILLLAVFIASGLARAGDSGFPLEVKNKDTESERAEPAECPTEFSPADQEIKDGMAGIELDTEAVRPVGNCLELDDWYNCLEFCADEFDACLHDCVDDPNQAECRNACRQGWRSCRLDCGFVCPPRI